MLVHLDSDRYLNVVEYGEGSDFDIVLLHGNGESHTIFNRLGPALAEFYHVLAIDSPGHGDSYMPETYSYSEMARDVYDTMRKLRLDRPLLVGYSDGAILALLIALEDPNYLSALVLSGGCLSAAGLTDEARTEMWTAAERQIATYGSVKPLLKLMLEQPEISLDSLRQIQIPTLVTAGEHDLISQEHSGLIAAAIPQANLMIFENEDHGSYIVNSDFLAPHIKELRDLMVVRRNITDQPAGEPPANGRSIL